MKKVFCYIILAWMFLMLAACGKPSSQKTFENFFKEFQTDLIKREEKSVEPFKTILKIYEKTTYNINKVKENGEYSQLDVTIKVVNLNKYTAEFLEITRPLIEKESDEEKVNELAINYFGKILKNEKNLEFTETNIQVQMQKINGKWRILNTDDIYTAIIGSPIAVEIVP